MNSLKSIFPGLSNRQWQTESLLLGGTGLVLGALAGLGVWLFKRLIDLAHLAAYDGLGGLLRHLGSWMIVLVPVAGGLVVGLLLHFFVGEERHHGVAGIMEAMAVLATPFIRAIFRRELAMIHSTGATKSTPLWSLNGHVEPTYAMRQEPVGASVICRQPTLSLLYRASPSEPGNGHSG